MTFYRITLLEWTSETNYNDTIYLDNMMNVNCHNFRKLETAIKWLKKNKDIVLKHELTNLDTDVISIDCDIEEWEDDFCNGIVYTTNLWTKNLNKISIYVKDLEKNIIVSTPKTKEEIKKIIIGAIISYKKLLNAIGKRGLDEEDDYITHALTSCGIKNYCWEEAI